MSGRNVIHYHRNEFLPICASHGRVRFVATQSDGSWPRPGREALTFAGGMTVSEVEVGIEAGSALRLTGQG